MISDPPGSFINGSDNSFGYLVGSNVNLTCLVTPTPPSDSEYSWSCSTGCFVDMEIEQSVNVSGLEVTDEGVLNCSVMIDGIEFVSSLFQLVISGKLSIRTHYYNSVSCYQVQPVLVTREPSQWDYHTFH